LLQVSSFGLGGIGANIQSYKTSANSLRQQCKGKRNSRKIIFTENYVNRWGVNHSSILFIFFFLYFLKLRTLFSIVVYLSALKFYSSLGFKRDITSPTDGEAGAKYQILSKLNAELCKNHHEY